jgi:hypothetical protein
MSSCFQNFKKNSSPSSKPSGSNKRGTMAYLLDLFRNKIGKLVDRDTTDIAFREIEIDETVLNNTQKYPTRHRCSQRLGKGLFFTDKEKKEKISRLRKIVLP